MLVVGDYELLYLLGEGSYGSVYLCKHRGTNQVACAKLEDLETTPNQVLYEYRMYTNFAKTPASSFVPKAFAHGEAGDFRYVIMSRGGPDLETVIDTHTDNEKLQLMHSLIDGVRAIHDSGVVHRDLKPKNVLLKLGSRTDVTIIDFGLAKRYRMNYKHIANTIKGTVAGTSRYCSVPCQLCTQAARRDDMYSLCYTMAVLFKRVLPWQNLSGKKKEKLRKTVTLKRILTPSEALAGCPEPLVHIYTMVMQLGFQQRPDYEAYQSIIRNYLKRVQSR